MWTSAIDIQTFANKLCFEGVSYYVLSYGYASECMHGLNFTLSNTLFWLQSCESVRRTDLAALIVHSYFVLIFFLSL